MQHGHDVNPKALDSGGARPKVTSMTTAQYVFAQRRHIDRFRIQLNQGGAKPLKICGIGQHGEIDVAAELGGAV
jgi:hypothetical protein